MSRPVRAVAAIAGLLAVLVGPLATSATGGPPAAKGDPPLGEGTAGPPYDYSTELMGEELGAPLVPLPDQALISRSEHGYLYRAGRQDSRLTITLTEAGTLLFVDTGTRSFKRVARGCRQLEVATGVAAECRVPGTISTEQPLLVEVWPRLGNDHVDAHTLPATFAMTVLGDAGHERVRFGAGPDFFNGHTGTDRVRGGAGNDWIRSGHDDDVIRGGSGHDQLVDIQGADTMYGGAGRDRVDAGPGNDLLGGGTGADNLMCGDGHDEVLSDARDRLQNCE